MNRHLTRATILGAFAVGLGCAGVPTEPAPAPKPRPAGKPTPKGTPSPSPSPSGTFKPSSSPSTPASPTPSGSPSTPASPTPSGTPTPGPPASEQEVASATIFPFTEVGQRWNYKLSLGASFITLPGTLQLTTQAVASASSEVFTVFDVDTSNPLLGGSSGGGKPYHVERVQTISRADGNPYAKLVSLLFDQSGQGVASSSTPVSTREDVTVAGKAYQGAVRQKFKTEIGSTTLQVDMYLTAEEGMVKEVANGDKLPAGLAPPTLGSIDKVPFKLTLELEKREKVDPQFLASGTQTASPALVASPTAPASGSITP